MTELSHTEHEWIDFEEDLEARRESVAEFAESQGVWG
jgi:hypothetical protein